MREPRPGANTSLSALQVVVALALLIITILFYAQNEAATVAAVILSDGLVALAWIASATLLGTAILRLCRITAEPALLWTTGAGLGLGIFSLLMLGLGLAGFASRGAVYSLMIGSIIGGGAVVWLKRESTAPLLHTPDRSRWLLVLAAPFLAISLVGACLPAMLLWWPGDPHPYDVVSYHLQVPHEWYELGRIVPLSHNVFSFFPFNSEMHDLAAMYLQGGAVAGMYTSQFLSVGFSILMLLAIYSSLPSSDSRLGRALAFLLTASLPWVVMLSCVAYVESLLMLFVALSVAWALRAVRSDSTAATRSLALGGIFAGLAAGTKIIAVPMLIVALPMALVLSALVTRAAESIRMKRLLVGCGVFLLTATLVVSPWLVRNLLWTGNPIFPVAMSTLGHGSFSPEQVERFRVAHTAPKSSSGVLGRLASFGSEVLKSPQYVLILWPLAIAAAVQRRRRIETWVCIFLLLGMAGVWMVATHLIGRFFVIAIPIAGILIAGMDWRRAGAVGVAIVAIFGGLSFWNLHVRFADAATSGRRGAFGLLDFRPLLAEELIPIIDRSSGAVVLAGDSRAFIYPIPMSRLRYRVVFDLNFSGIDVTSARQLLGAWAGASLDSLPPGSVIYVDPIEWKRLSDSYHIPPIPADLPGPRDRSYILTPADLSR